MNEWCNNYKRQTDDDISRIIEQTYVSTIIILV